MFFLSSFGILQNCSIVVSNPNAGKASRVSQASVARSLPIEISVEPLYTGGSNWNDYVLLSDTSMECDGNSSSECTHAGEAKKVIVSGVSSCSGLTMSETLNAFDWSCEVDEGVATFKTRSLKSGKGLSDLLTISGFINNSVTVSYAGESVSSVPYVWWSNEVIGLTAINTPSDMSSFGMTSFNLDGDPSIEVYKLNSPTSVGKIFVIGANLNIEGIRIQDDKTALVVLPGYIVTRIAGSNGNNCATNATTCLIDGESVNYSWLEGTFAAASTQYNTAYRNSYFNRFQNLTLKDASGGTANLGISWDNSDSNTVNGAKILNVSQQGFYLYGSRNKFNDLQIANNTNNFYGLMLVSSQLNYFKGLRLTNINGDALRIINSTSNNFVDTLIAGATGGGVVISNASSNILLGLTSVNISGNRNISITGDFNVLSNAVAANSPQSSIYINNANFTQFHNTLGYASDYAFDLSNSDSVYAYGVLKYSASNPCLISTLTSSNIFDLGAIGCYVDPIGNDYSSQINPSNIKFKGPVNVDSLNAHTNALLSYGLLAYSSITDWFNFDSNYRAWGNIDTSSPPSDPLNSDTMGRCSTGDCTVWDWRLKSDDTVNAFQNSCPTGDEFLESFWANDYIVYLRNAYEVSNDNIGNDNILCEANETCVFMPHMGAFQGDGNLTNSSCDPTISSRAIPNVTFKEFENLIY